MTIAENSSADNDVLLADISTVFGKAQNHVMGATLRILTLQFADMQSLLNGRRLTQELKSLMADNLEKR